MNNEVCFVINSKKLYVDEYLVEFNIPIFFICKDDDNNRYAVICENTSELEYLICRVPLNSLYKMLKNELSLYDFIYQSIEKWILKSGDTLESDLVETVQELQFDYYPKKNEYLDLNSDKICNYIKRIENELDHNSQYEKSSEENYSIELSRMFLETIASFTTVVNESNNRYKISRNSVKQRIPLKLALVGGLY